MLVAVPYQAQFENNETETQDAESTSFWPISMQLLLQLSVGVGE